MSDTAMTTQHHGFRWTHNLTLGHGVLPVLFIAMLHPAVSGAVALAAGIISALVFGNPYLTHTRKLAPKLLALSVMGLGGAMNLRTVAHVGLSGVGYTVVGISLTLAMGLWLGKKLKVTQDTAMLVAVGTAICGGSAIAATAPTIHAKDSEISVALVTVFILNAVALVLFPLIGHGLHLSQRSFGLLCALAIHDTSSVVGASMAYGNEALQVATTVKLARALWIVPVTLVTSLVWSKYVTRKTAETTAPTKPRRPWFILGFLALSALVTVVTPLQPMGALIAKTSHRTLVLTLFLTGCGLTHATIKRVGIRPLIQGVTLWAFTVSATLIAVVLKLATL